MEKVEQKVSDCLFYDGANHEPLSDKTRAWLVKQLAAYPERVDENNTCAGGALQKLATCDYPHVIQATRANDEEIAELVAALAELWRVIDIAGLSNLAKGVQLGQVSWFVKASDAVEQARATLAKRKPS